jgi:hypothetical protein
MVNIAILVDRALRTAGVPIDGVSIGDVANRATWSAQYTAAATPAHKVTGAALLLSVAIDAAAQATQDQLDAQAFVDTLPIWAKALALALVDQLNVIRAALPAPLGPITVAQAIAAIRAKAGTL